MFSIDPVHIQFHIPARGPLGREEVLGKIRFLPAHVEFNWRLKGNVFVGGKGEMHTLTVPYGEIEHVELIRKWWRLRRLVLRISNPALVAEIPGVELGKMTLEIDERSREEAKKLASLIDFKRSAFLLDEHDQRLAAISDEEA
ncbi:MAG: hypothetical protein OSB65_07365 [Roseibacillus sp.]|nr:hypothetical protein [Roseibacillus sp.]